MNRTYDYIEMVYPAKPEYVGVIRLSLSGIANRMGFSYDEIEDMKIAISEACTNVVDHAYQGEESGNIRIGFGVYSNRLELVVADNGQSFNFEEIKNELGPISKTHPVETLPEGGLGLFLIETLMDTVKVHNNQGVTVFMTKYLQGEQVEWDEEKVSAQ
ncbi:anti-sigma B factor RsbW [Sutcliffiella cohnii]|uniref:Serine-protein kinase RsbW n=1 Tax=Sutcliffiella cohnii TaxID=33932 RepID=A0A223KXF1_9BACI|nr:anti-sigma B factor RsbW [Sutcliffiella cohnii]AST94136.1 anti-sigma B factor RsbW [Sutcliffiella cohnii]